MAKKEPVKGMDAVVEKSASGGRKPAFKRKPGVAIMIAVGKPKPEDDNPLLKGLPGKGRALNRALDKVKAPTDNESLLAELDDLNERVAKLEQMMDQMHGEKPESMKHEMGKGDTEEDEGEY